MPPQVTIILAALEVEARAAAAALGIAFARGRVLKSLPPLPPVEIHTIGMRAVFLPAALSLLSPLPACRVLVVGLAGALEPSLRVGDVVYDSPDGGDSSTGGDPPTGGPLPDGVAIRSGRIHTADALVATAAGKRALFERTGALAVDMEQSIVRLAFSARGIRVAGLRAVSDAAGTSLPAELPSLVDALGRPRHTALAARLLRRPALAASLARLGIASSRATRSLGAAIRRMTGEGAGRE